MSKFKIYDKSLYPSIENAIWEILDGHMIDAGDPPVYSAKALENVCFFLAENDIPHSYTLLSAPPDAKCDELVSLIWHEDGKVGNEVWYTYGKNFSKKNYKLSLTVSAENLEDIQDWIYLSDMKGVEVLDWKGEQIL